MTCDIEDHGAELRQLASVVHNKLMKTESWEEFYEAVLINIAGCKLAILMSDCKPHITLFRSTLETMFVSYFKVRTEQRSDVSFYGFRGEFSDHFHRLIIELSNEISELSNPQEKKA